jgi:hypothetical protein
MRLLPGPLLVITDRHQARHSIETIGAAVGRGCGRWLLLRDKDLAQEERRGLAIRLAKIAAEHGFALSAAPTSISPPRSGPEFICRPPRRSRRHVGASAAPL